MTGEGGAGKSWREKQGLQKSHSKRAKKEQARCKAKAVCVFEYTVGDAVCNKVWVLGYNKINRFT